MSKPKSQDKPEALTADEVIALAQQTGEILEGVIDAQRYQPKNEQPNTGEPDDVAI
jgi:hypothetical protein